jgi:hypothetical protein
MVLSPVEHLGDNDNMIMVRNNNNNKNSSKDLNFLGEKKIFGDIE